MNEMSSKRIIITNFSWLFVNKVINIFAGIISSVVVVRYLGTTNNGILNYVVSFCSLFSAIAAMGAENFVTKEYARGDSDPGTVGGTSFMMISCGSIVAFFLTNLSATILNLEEYALYIFILSLQFLTKPLTIFQFWFIGKSRSKYYSLTQNIVHLLCLALKIILVALKQDFIWFVVVSTLEYMLLEFGLLIGYIVGKVKFGAPKVNFKELKRYFKLCFPLMFSSIAITVYMRFDQLMIGTMLGDSELGIYSVAVKIAEYWYFIPLIIYNSYFPLLACEFGHEDPSRYQKSLQLFSDIQGGIGLIAAIGITFFSTPAIYILYGQEYLEAGPILAAYCWAGLFVGLSYVKVAQCTNLNITNFQMISTCIGAVVNISLNAILINVLGAIGAAWATVIAQFISSIFVCLVYRPLKNVGIMQVKSLFPFVRLWTYFKVESNNKKK